MQRIGLLVAVGLAGGCGPERSASLSGSVSGFEIPTNPGDAYFRLDQDGLAVTLSERGGSCGSEVAALHDNTRVEVLVRAIAFSSGARWHIEDLARGQLFPLTLSPDLPAYLVKPRPNFDRDTLAATGFSAAGRFC